MIFRLINSQLGSPSPDYGSHIIMSISGIFCTYINPHIISFSSPILISGARNNIDHIHNISGWIYMCCRQQPGTNWLLTSLYISDPVRRSNCTQCPRSRTLADVPYISVRGQSCASVRMISKLASKYRSVLDGFENNKSRQVIQYPLTSTIPSGVYPKHI